MPLPWLGLCFYCAAFVCNLFSQRLSFGFFFILCLQFFPFTKSHAYRMKAKIACVQVQWYISYDYMISLSRLWGRAAQTSATTTTHNRQMCNTHFWYTFVLTCLLLCHSLAVISESSLNILWACVAMHSKSKKHPEHIRFRIDTQR